MAIRLYTNPTGQIARQNFTDNVFFLSDSVRKLSSGLRVNKTADDPVAVTIASQLDAQGLGLGQAVKNANDGIAAMQVVDNSLAEAMAILDLVLTKAQTAAQTASQDDLAPADRLAMQADIDKLLAELDQLVGGATYNDLPLLTGAFTNKAFQVGPAPGDTVALSLPSARLYQIGQVQTGEMTISSARGGQVNLRLVNQANGEEMVVDGVTLAYANDPDYGMGAVAARINAYSATTGIAARALVSVQSGAALSAGTTPEAFAINGVRIGVVKALASDSDGRLLSAINGKSASHGVRAQVAENGGLLLSADDGRPIEVSGSGGALGFFDAEMTTFGLTRILQSGAYGLSLTDSAVGLAVPFLPTMQLAGPVTTTLDSTLAENSVLGNNSRLAAGWTAGLDVTGLDLDGLISTTESSTLAAGSVLAAGSILAASSTLGGAVSLAGVVSTGAESLLHSGSVLAAGSVIAPGSYLTNAIVTAGGPMAAGQILAADATLSVGLTLSRDMLLWSGSELAAGSSLTAGSQVGGDIQLGGALTLTQAMTLSAGSTIVDSDGVTQLAAGSTIGGLAQLGDAELLVQAAMLVKAGSTLAAGSELALGSTIGGATVLAGNHTASYDLYLAAGSSLAADSTIKAGTTLTNDLLTTGGPLGAGTVTAQEYHTTGTNSLGQAMTLKQGSTLANGSVLAANSSNESAVQLGGEEVLRLDEISVLSRDDAVTAIEVIVAAKAEVNRIRQQAAGVADQLAGFATVQGGSKAMMEGARAKLMGVDFAEEAVNFSRMERLIRSSSFALIQANVAPGNVMMIMQGGAGDSKANQFFISALNRMITSVEVN